MTTNRETVIKGLECCKGEGFAVRYCPDDCPYANVDEDIGYCNAQLLQDAITLLKGQEASENGGD